MADKEKGVKVDRKKGLPAGMEDMLPAEKLLFDRLMSVLSKVVGNMGFSPIDTPHIEWMDTLKGHDAEGGKLIYRTFNGHELPTNTENLEKAISQGLRFDLTVPLARFYGQHAHNLPYPFRRYQWGTVNRGEKSQTSKGRYREFYQFDADSIGVKGAISDAETAAMLATAMKELGLPAMVKINNRRLLDGLMEVGNIQDKDAKTAVFGAIDDYTKIGKEAVVAHVTQATNAEFAQLVADYLSVSGTANERLYQLEQLIGSSSAAQEGLTNLREVFSLLEAGGYSDMVSVSPEIVRGLGYYTGILFETFVTGSEHVGSVASGGRYDNLIEDLGGPSEPAVDASFGVSRLMSVLKEHGWESSAQISAEVLVINFAQQLNAVYFQLASQLRESGIPTMLYSDPKKLVKQFQYAEKLGIPYAVIIGEDEHAKGTAIIRNLEERKEEEVAISNVISTLLNLLGK